jgi:hypothetical protein
MTQAELIDWQDRERVSVSVRDFPDFIAPLEEKEVLSILRGVLLYRVVPVQPTKKYIFLKNSPTPNIDVLSLTVFAISTITCPFAIQSDRLWSKRI